MYKQFFQPKMIAIAVVAAFSISVIQAQTIVKTEKVSVSSNIYQPAYNTQDGFVYVSGAREQGNTGYIYKIDGKTLKTVDSIAVPESAPMGIGINNKTQTLYSTNSRTSTVTAINLKTGEQTHIKATVPGANAREIIVDETRNIIYVTSVRAGGGIWVIDGATNTFQRYIYNLGRAITGAALDVENNRLYATAMGEDQIIVVNAETGIVEKKFNAHGKRPTNVYFDAAKKRLFVANQASENITVLDAEKGDLIKEIPTGKGALGVDFDPKKDLIYVANRHGRTITIINGTSLEVVKTFEMEALPNTFSINHATGDVYVTNKDAVDEKDDAGNTFRREAKNADSISLISIR